MADTLGRKGHTHVYQVSYGEEACVARTIVRAYSAAGERLFLAKQHGALEPADGRPGFEVSPLSPDGLWPTPPWPCGCGAPTRLGGLGACA
ncbi:hypothetical protein [Thiorhodococcus minor]|uniref:Uncharacterized protein n=1 Tax=Thiorhodococcus minor TaxID=57489 RepID=A0A6M0JZS3_9GAMM|nr:hypothetical protein [Thiorhodococcus minor]NEV63038.1 hypothetical protein [Thiorhodococcus minor]